MDTTFVFKIKISKKKKIALISLITSLILGVSITSIAIANYNLSLYDREYTWSQDIGDKYYFALMDSYWNQSITPNETEDYIRNFRTFLKSEIIDKKDLETDFDDEEDLIIMSSFLFGMEDVFSLEIPNWFDINQLITSGYNAYAILNNILSSNDIVLAPVATPNAIHIQHSAIYQILEDLFDYLNLKEFSDPNYSFPSFNYTWEFLDWIFNQYDVEDFFDDFESDTLGNQPTNFSITDNTSGNSSALITIDPDDALNQMLNISQIEDTPSNIYAQWNSHRDYLSDTSLADRVNLDEYYFVPEEYSYILEFDSNNMNHTFQCFFGTEYFDLTGTIVLTTKDFEGRNGMNFRIKEGLLQYFVGDYIYSSGDFRESLPSEMGWHNLTYFFVPYNISNDFYEGSPNGNRFKITVTPNLENFLFFSTADFDYKLKIESLTTSLTRTWWNVDCQMDCPYDLMEYNCYDNLKGENRDFNSRNMTDLIFNVSETITPHTADLIDNVSISGNAFYFLNNLEQLLTDYYYSQFLLVSLYHLLFFPNEFDFDNIAGLANLMNELFTYIIDDILPVNVTFNADKIYTITNDVNSSMLNISISYETLEALHELFSLFLSDALGWSTSGFLEGDMDAQLDLVFDKRIGQMNATILTIKYNDLGIMRKIGIELQAMQYANGSGNGWYPDQPTSDFDDLYTWLLDTAIWALVIVGIVSVVSSIGLSELIRYIRKKRK